MRAVAPFLAGASEMRLRAFLPWSLLGTAAWATTFTLVGYGVDIGDKKAQIVVPERRFTTSLLKNVQDEVVVFQINDNNAQAGGGSCFGDSGGAVFLNGYVLGDASYVNSLTCNATGSYQRTDTAYSRSFLNRFLGP